MVKTIYHNGEFKSIAPTTSSSHYTITPTLEKIKKSDAKPVDFDETSIVKIPDGYGRIIGLPKLDNENTFIYRIRSLLDAEPKKDRDGTIDIYENSKEYAESDLSGNFTKKIQLKILNTASSVKYYNHSQKISPITVDFILEITDKFSLSPKLLLLEIAQYIRITKDIRYRVENIIKTPFIFITEHIAILTFNKADDIDQRLGLNSSSSERRQAWLFSLMHSKNTFYIPEKEFDIDYEKNYMKIYRDGVVISRQRLIDTQILIEKIIDGKKYITTQYFIDLEKKQSDNMIKQFLDKQLILENPVTGRNITDSDIDKYITQFESLPGKPQLNHHQRLAVKLAFTNRFCCITGFPGTGKTTIVECIIWIRKKLNAHNNISICAPTGLAYKNMHSKVKQYELNSFASGTLHKVLLSTFHHIKRKRESSPEDFTDDDSDFTDIPDTIPMEDIDLLIIDEFSMVDTMMFERILYWQKYFGFQLLIIGDPNQLPSIKQGNLLENIIESCIFNDNIVKLTEICRQESGKLLEGIQKMANGKILRRSDFDNESLLFRGIHYFKSNKSLNTESVNKLIDQYAFNDSTTKFLCFNSSENACINTGGLNQTLQKKYNPDGKDIVFSGWISKTPFRIKDKIMLTKNISQQKSLKRMERNEAGEYVEKTIVQIEYRANGDEARIISCDYEEDTVDIQYLEDGDSGFINKITISELYELYVLSYALSVHKSQGSQYENIIFMMDSSFNFTKKLVFTAISRSQERCFIICEEAELITAQRQNSSNISLCLREFNEYQFE
jgi:ATP-dependent exoDNAse (exonuclease V) alpha subunit